MTSEDAPRVPSSKQEFLQQVRGARSRLEALVSSLHEAELTRVHEPEGWSVKDVLAHIAEWESYVVRRIEAQRQGQTPEVWAVDDEQVDAVNSALYERNKDLSPDEALRRFRESHDRALATIESLSEAELLDDSLRGSVLGEWGSPVWMHVSANTAWHYEEHAEMIERWLGERPTG